MDTALLEDWLDLRLAALRGAPLARADEGTREGLARQLGERLVEARRAGELATWRDASGRLRAAAMLSPDDTSFFGVPVVHAALDLTPGDAEAAARILETLGGWPLDDRFNLQLPAAHRTLLPALRAVELHVGSIVLVGEPEACHRRLFPGGTPGGRGWGDLEVRSFARADVEPVLDLKRREFGRNPRFGWFCGLEGRLALDRHELVGEAERGDGRRRVIVAAGEVLGTYGYHLDANNPFFGRCAGVELTFDVRLQGRGLATLAYDDLLTRLARDRVGVFKGGTAQPAVLALARRMGRALYSVNVRRGPDPFGPGHFAAFLGDQSSSDPSSSDAGTSR